MVFEIEVCSQTIKNMNEALEELFVLAGVETLSELPEMGDVTDDGEDVRGVNDLFLNSSSILSQEAHHDGVEDKLLILK